MRLLILLVAEKSINHFILYNHQNTSDPEMTYFYLKNNSSFFIFQFAREIQAMLSTIIAILASQVVGASWYSPTLTGKSWSCYAYPGLSVEEIGKALSPAINYVIGLISSVFTTLLLKYYLLQYVLSISI